MKIEVNYYNLNRELRIQLKVQTDDVVIRNMYSPGTTVNELLDRYTAVISRVEHDQEYDDGIVCVRFERTLRLIILDGQSNLVVHAYCKVDVLNCLRALCNCLHQLKRCGVLSAIEEVATLEQSNLPSNEIMDDSSLRIIDVPQRLNHLKVVVSNAAIGFEILVDTTDIKYFHSPSVTMQRVLDAYCEAFVRIRQGNIFVFDDQVAAGVGSDGTWISFNRGSNTGSSVILRGDIVLEIIKRIVQEVAPLVK